MNRVNSLTTMLPNCNRPRPPNTPMAGLLPSNPRDGLPLPGYILSAQGDEWPWPIRSKPAIHSDHRVVDPARNFIPR